MATHYTKMEIQHMIDKLLTVSDVAAYLGVPVATVYAWNSRGLGPKRYRLGRHIRYQRSEVDTWIQRQAAPA